VAQKIVGLNPITRPIMIMLRGLFWKSSLFCYSTDVRTIHRNIVSALIFSKDGKLLMGMKNPAGGGVYADCWHIPGGGIDDGEDQITALRREILEEVGIDTTEAKVSLADDQGSGEAEKTLKDTDEVVLCKMKFNVYRVDLDEDAEDVKTSLDDDLAKIAWVGVSELGGYKLTPPSMTLFTRLGYL
jgi:8-oxo-dGTP pyrophosphatase MutT (NUDIX family)